MRPATKKKPTTPARAGGLQHVFSKVKVHVLSSITSLR